MFLNMVEKMSGQTKKADKSESQKLKTLSLTKKLQLSAMPGAIQYVNPTQSVVSAQQNPIEYQQYSQVSQSQNGQYQPQQQDLVSQYQQQQQDPVSQYQNVHYQQQPVQYGASSAYSDPNAAYQAQYQAMQLMNQQMDPMSSLTGKIYSNIV
jgi:hypothetical protein